MKLKYKLLAESINFKGAKLYRIKALKDFAGVKKGDLGGYIESEANLSHDGDCWVFGNAKVYGNAKVFGNALVYGNAEVFGSAEVRGNAWVQGYTQIKGDQIVQEGIYNLPKHTLTSDIDKGLEDAKAGRLSELTPDLLEQEENKMSRLKELEKMWDEYCKASDINVTDDIQIQLNVSEPRLKVGIFRGDKGMHFTLEEIKALVKVLDSL